MACKSPLKYHGGKSYLAKRIIELMPPHTHYAEPFFGGGSVLFAKSFEGISETVNDINSHLQNFWESLRQRPTQLIRDLQITPFSERRFEHERRNPFNPIRSPDWRSAASFFICNRQSRQGLGKDYATPTRRTRRGMNENVSAWLSAIDGLAEAHERLSRVEIRNMDAIEFIQKYDHKNCLFYCDPPYMHETRVTTSDYDFEMSRVDHANLLVNLARIRGDFVLSGYRSETYDVMAEECRWHRIDIGIDNKASSKKKKEIKTECLWMNF